MSCLVYEDMGSGLPKNYVAVFESRGDATYFINKAKTSEDLESEEFWFNINKINAIWGFVDHLKITEVPIIKRDFRMMPRS